MHRGNVVITASAVAAVGLGALVGIVAAPGQAVHGGSDGRTCVAYGGDPRTTEVTVPVMTSGTVHVLGAVATGEDGTAERVRVRVLPGVTLDSDGFSMDDAVLDGHRARDARGVVLPAGRTSTFVLTITRRASASSATVSGFDVTSVGPLGTVRTDHVAAGLGIATEASLPTGDCTAT